MLKEKIGQIDKHKHKFRYEIINFKKKNDLLKEKIKHINIKSNTIVHELQDLVYRKDN